MNTIHSFTAKTENFSPDSKVWIWVAETSIDAKDIVQIESELAEFSTSWNAHGDALTNCIQLIFNQIIIATVDGNHFSASGCSIDKLTHLIQNIDNQYVGSLFNRKNAFIFADNQLIAVPISDIRSGKINPETEVLNPYFDNLSDFRAHFVQPLHQSKYANLISKQSN